MSAFKTLRTQEFLQHLRCGVSVFRGEGFDDVCLHQLMGYGGNRRNGIADVAVKNLGNLMAALDFAAFVIDEFDVVADVSVQVFKDVFHDAVCHADQLQAAADKDVLERAQTGGVALGEFHNGGGWHFGVNAVDGITDGAQAFRREGFVADVFLGNEQQIDDFGEFAVFALFGGNE